MAKRLLLMLAIAFLVASTVVGCNLFDSPESAAKEIANSIFAGDFERMRDRICAEQARFISDDSLRRSQENFTRSTKTKDVKFDTSALNFRAEVNGDTAFVTPTGRFKVESPQGTFEFNLDNSPLPRDLQKIRMVREDGWWKLCPDSLFFLRLPF